MGSSIDKLFRGYPLRLTLLGSTTLTNTQSPPPQKCWLILSGDVTHVTGTISQLAVLDSEKALILDVLLEVPAATATLLFPLFNVVTTGLTYAASWRPTFVMPNEKLYLQGDATAIAYVQVLEFALT